MSNGYREPEQKAEKKVELTKEQKEMRFELVKAVSAFEKSLAGLPPLEKKERRMEWNSHLPEKERAELGKMRRELQAIAHEQAREAASKAVADVGALGMLKQAEKEMAAEIAAEDRETKQMIANIDKLIPGMTPEMKKAIQAFVSAEDAKRGTKQIGTAMQTEQK